MLKAVSCLLIVTSALAVALVMPKVRLGIASPRNLWARLVTLKLQALFTLSPRARRMPCLKMISMQSVGVLL
jgi:hypothetical protein